MRKLHTLAAIILCAMLLLAACGEGSTPEEESVGEVSLGKPFEYNGLEITLSKNIGFTQFRSRHSDNDGAYVFYIPTTIKNISESAKGLEMWEVTVFSPEGVSLTNTVNSYEIEWAFEEESIFTVGSIQPDVVAEGNIYVLYDKDGEYIITLDNHTDSAEVKFELKFNFDAVPQVKTEYEMGEMLDVNGLEVTFINDISWGFIRKSWSDNDGEPYFFLPVSLRNTSDEARGFPYGFDIFGPNGQALDSITWDIDEEDITRASDLLPGASAMGYLHVLYVGDGDYTLHFNDWSLLDDLSVRLPVTLGPDDLPEIQTEFALGETFVFDNLEITIINDAEWGIIDSRWSDLHERDVFIFPVTVTNVGDSANSLGWNVKLYGSNGIELENISFYTEDDNVLRSGDIRPGATLQGRIYILYDGDGEYVIEFSDYREGDLQVIFNIRKPG